jgi:hypothetical protein
MTARIGGRFWILLLALTSSLASQPRPAPDEGLTFDPHQGKAALASFTEDPVVDREAYEENLRRRLPVLRAAVRDARHYVDSAMLYQRQLGMHGDGGAFRRALPRSASPDGEIPDRGPNAIPESRPSAEGPRGGPPFSLLFFGSLFSACVAFYVVTLRRSRGSRRREDDPPRSR